MFDLRTIILVTPALLALATLMLALALLTDRRSWALRISLAGMIAVSLGTLLVGLRGLVPETISVLVGNMLILSGPVLLLFAAAGLMEAGRWQRRVLWVVSLGVLAGFGGIVFFQAQEPNLSARILIHSIAMVGLGTGFLAVAFEPPRGLLAPAQMVRFGGAALLIMGFARMGLLLRHGGADDLFLVGWGGQLAITVGIFGQLAQGLAILWLYQLRLVLAKEKARTALEDRDRQLAALEDNLPGILFTWDELPDGSIQVPYVAGRVKEITSFTAAEIIANPTVLRVHPDEIEAWRESRQNARVNLQDWTFEGRFTLPSGRMPFWRAMSSPVRLPDGRVRFHGVLIDVTDQHRHLDDLERSHALVEDQARQLREAATTAQLANKAKSEFIASMSHELRTPLNAILGFSEMVSADILRRGVDQTYRDYASDINAAGAHLLGLINDLIDLSKVESGRLTLQPEVIPVDQAVEESTRLLLNRASNHQLKISRRVDDDLPPLLADRRAVRQILFNLLSNAIKFTPEHGRVTVTAGLAPPVEGSPQAVQIAVSDTGIGIPEEDQESLFKPFFRAGNAGHVEGTGLGLNLARTMTEAMGGAISLSSTEDIGTTIIVSLPTASGPSEKGIAAPTDRPD